MRYICLVYHDEKQLDTLSPGELELLAGQCSAWVGDIQKGGHHVFSAGLQCVRTAMTLRRRNGALSMTDGPFAETKEFLGGFTILNARDLNEAIQLASTHPAARIASIEVRPVLEPDAELTDPLDRKLWAAIRRNHRSSIDEAVAVRISVDEATSFQIRNQK
jgi:hypothetical protein